MLTIILSQITYFVLDLCYLTDDLTLLKVVLFLDGHLYKL